MPVPTVSTFGSKMMSCGGKPTFSDEQIVGALADGNLPLERIRLAAFVKRHHDDRRAVATDELRAWCRNFSSPSLSEMEFTMPLP